MSKSLSLKNVEYTTHLKGFKCLHLNCCSIVTKVDLICTSLVEPSKFDFYCFTESWIKPDMNSNLFEIDDYNIIRSDRGAMNPSGGFVHGGGIVCYLKDHYAVEIYDKPHVTTDLEMLTIVLNRQDHRKIYIIFVYRPPSGNIDMALKILDEVLIKIKSDRSRFSIILLGDFNIDVSLNKKDVRLTNLIKNFSTENGLNQYIDRPTRFGPISCSIIDLIFSDSGNVSYYGTLNYHISDHIPIFIVIKKHKESYPKVIFIGRTYLNYSKDLLHNILTSHNWGRFYAAFDVDTAWVLLFSAILAAANKLRPIKNFHIKQDLPPWFSDDITELSKNCDEFFRIGRKNKDQTMLNEARYLRNTIKRDLPELKNDYYLHLMNTNQENVKKFWTCMNEIICSKSKSDVTIIKHPETNLLLGPTESVEVLNHYLVNVADTLVKKIPNITNNPSSELSDCASTLRFNNCVTPDKIKKILKEFLPTKSSGCLKISSRIYLDAFEILHEQLAFIVNLSLRTSVFPSAWKRSIVTPIQKKGDRCVVGNIRPISLIHMR